MHALGFRGDTGNLILIVYEIIKYYHQVDVQSNQPIAHLTSAMKKIAPDLVMQLKQRVTEYDAKEQNDGRQQNVDMH